MAEEIVEIADDKRLAVAGFLPNGTRARERVSSGAPGGPGRHLCAPSGAAADLSECRDAAGGVAGRPLQRVQRTRSRAGFKRRRESSFST